jgi:hypothetical protein
MGAAPANQPVTGSNRDGGAYLVLDVVLLSLDENTGGYASKERPRVPVLACADALRSGGAAVDIVTAGDDAEIDTALKAAEAGAAGQAGETGQAGESGQAGEARLIVAATTDSQLRAVVRRLVRRHAPPPSTRPDNLAPDRTIFDLPPLAVLPLTPAIPDLVRRLRLPVDPVDVAAATLGGRTRRLDLVRHDGGSVMLHQCLLGGVDGSGRAVPWRGRVEVDDAVLTDGGDPIVACAIANAGHSDVDGLPLVVNADPADGALDVAVAVPVVRPRRLLRRASLRFEVRRARGRAVSVTPHVEEIHIVDDGVAGTLTHKRSWWIEREAWAAYVL